MHIAIRKFLQDFSLLKLIEKHLTAAYKLDKYPRYFQIFQAPLPSTISLLYLPGDWA